jgi:hypothetical protein
MYKITPNYDNEVNQTSVIRLSDNAIIPFDIANTDYQEFVRWCEQGNEPEPAEVNNAV